MKINVFKKSMNPKQAGENEEIAVYVPENYTVKSQVIIALHGNWATYRRFENYAKYFCNEGFIFIAPTHRYHYSGNENDTNLGKVSIRDYAKDVVQIINKLYQGQLILDFKPETKCILMGHSMGGLIAQLVATQIQIKSLVLINSVPPAGITLILDSDYKKRLKRYRKPIIYGKPYLPDLETLALYVYNNMPEEKHRELYSGAVYESGTASREIIAGSGSGISKIVARCKSKPIKINFTKVFCDILIVNCKNDRIITPEIGEKVLKKIKHETSLARFFINAMNDEFKNKLIATHMLFPQFAHWPMAETNWEISAESMLKWFKNTTI